jgi:hypothetical protein
MLLFILSVVGFVALLYNGSDRMVPPSKSLHGQRQHWPMVPMISSSSGGGMDSRTKHVNFAMAPPQVNSNIDFSRVCLTDECIKEEGQRLARAFASVPFDSWLISKKKQKHNGDDSFINNNQTSDGQMSWQGLLLVRPYKTASSTLAGIALRIRHRCQDRINRSITINKNDDDDDDDMPNCAVQWGHARGQVYSYLTRRIPTKSLLIAPVRRAAARAYSASFFFAPSVSGFKSDATILADFQLQYRQWSGMSSLLPCLAFHERAKTDWVCR